MLLMIKDGKVWDKESDTFPDYTFDWEPHREHFGEGFLPSVPMHPCSIRSNTLYVWNCVVGRGAIA